MNKLILLPILSLLLCSCASITPDQQKAEDASKWVADREGLIEISVSTLVQVAVYSTNKDTAERQNILSVIHAVGSNLNALVENNISDPDSIRAALKVKEPYFEDVFIAIYNVTQAEAKNFDGNGYHDFIIEILKAVSKGLQDGSA